MRLSYKKYIVAAVLVLAGIPAVGQTLNSAYFTKDYKFRHTMNPAYGNEQGYFSIPALGNIDIDLRGTFGLKDIIMDNPLYPDSSDETLTTFLNPYISAEDALRGLEGINRLQASVGLTLLSAGFKGFGGYNTIELNAKISAGIRAPYEFFEFAKNIANNHYQIDDVYLRIASHAELALGHSHQINEKLRIGAKVKLLFGIARNELQFKDLTVDLSGNDMWTVKGTITSNVSMKGFKYESKTKEYEDDDREGETYEQVSGIDVKDGGIGGFGLAVDLGAIYQINENWTISAAVTDLGFIRWGNNEFAQSSGTAFEFNGFHNLSILSDDTESTLDEQIDELIDQFTDFAHLESKEDLGKRTTGISATVNVGAEYTLPVYRKLSFGLLSSTHIEDQFYWTEGRLSANWDPLKWLNGGVNVAVSNMSTSFGWVLNIHPKGFNFFVGMDHLVSELSKEFIPLTSSASVSLGMSIAW